MNVIYSKSNGNRGVVSVKLELTEIEGGEWALVLRIEGGRKYRERLMSLGIIPGVSIRIIRKARRNPMLIAVMDRQVVLGQDIAEKIIVNPLPSASLESG